MSRFPSFCLVLLAAACSRGEWATEFPVDKSTLTSVGENRFLPLRPGARQILKKDDTELVVTVLAETKVIDGVETRIVEERESRAGKLVEISRNYYAIDTATGNVYYFGEDVDEYRDGQVVGHEGSWASGANGAKFGLMMPGNPALHARYYEEMAPNVAMDRAEIVEVKGVFGWIAGWFQDCVRIEETTPLERGRETKVYCPGAGLVRDGDLHVSEVTVP